MGTYQVSLNKDYTRKAEIIRDKCYPKLTVDEAIQEFVRDSLNAKVSDEEAMKA